MPLKKTIAFLLGSLPINTEYFKASFLNNQPCHIVLPEITVHLHADGHRVIQDWLKGFAQGDS